MAAFSMDRGTLFWRLAARQYDTTMRHLVPDHERIVERVVEDATPAERVLDVATGTGTFALALARKGGSVEAVDFAPEMVAIAQKKAVDQKVTNVRFSLQSAYQLDFPDAHFDTVTCVNGLHVMDSPHRALAEMRRVLRPRGVLIVPTFCHRQSIRSMVLSSLLRLAGCRNLHRFSLDSLRRFVESCGFEVVRDDPVEFGGLVIGYLVGRRVE